MRVFVGVKSSKSLQNDVMLWQKKNQDLPLRFIKPENLHITLLPPWYEEDHSNSIKKIESMSFKSLRIVFDKIKVNYKNQLIWIESTKTPAEMFVLEKDLANKFGKGGVESKFKVHITIAKFKNPRSLEGLIFEQIKWEEKMDSITLFESVLGPKEASYKIIFSRPSD